MAFNGSAKTKMKANSSTVAAVRGGGVDDDEVHNPELGYAMRILEEMNPDRDLDNRQAVVKKLLKLSTQRKSVESLDDMLSPYYLYNHYDNLLRYTNIIPVCHCNGAKEN